DAKAPQVMAHLMPYPMMTPGVERAIDAVCLEHFQCNLSKRLTLYDDVKSNPFQNLLLSMAFEHEGLMRSLLSLASTHHYRCHGNQDFAYRALEQHSLAVQWLRKEMTALQLSKTESRLTIEDAMVASWLVLSLFCLCEGSTKGEYRMHMNVTRENLANYRSRNVEFNLFHHEYFSYHEFAALLTTYDQRSVLQDLGSVSWHPIEDYQRAPSKAGCMIGVYDGLLGFVPKIRLLRNHMRHASEPSNEDDIKIKGTMLEVAIIKWKPTWQSHSPNWYAALLYQHMILVYLYRTLQPSKSFHCLETSLNKGLDCLEAIAPDCPAQSNALLPLFILGCASFLPQHRIRVKKGLDRIREYTHFGNIQPAEDVVGKMWELMDERDERSWDWEKLMLDMGIDCLMT
ncbi:MAG: hypothetical protein Q9214_006872, partial [Letrouitia sp. 1 TL-2023]